MRSVKSKHKVLSHRKGVLGDSSLGELDERDVVFFYIEVTEDFNLLNLDANNLTVPQTGSSEDLTTSLLSKHYPMQLFKDYLQHIAMVHTIEED